MYTTRDGKNVSARHLGVCVNVNAAPAWAGTIKRGLGRVIFLSGQNLLYVNSVPNCEQRCASR
jgi:hypothetical protein